MSAESAADGWEGKIWQHPSIRPPRRHGSRGHCYHGCRFTAGVLTLSPPVGGCFQGTWENKKCFRVIETSALLWWDTLKPHFATLGIGALCGENM